MVAIIPTCLCRETNVAHSQEHWNPLCPYYAKPEHGEREPDVIEWDGKQPLLDEILDHFQATIKGLQESQQKLMEWNEEIQAQLQEARGLLANWLAEYPYGPDSLFTHQFLNRDGGDEDDNEMELDEDEYKDIVMRSVRKTIPIQGLHPGPTNETGATTKDVAEPRSERCPAKKENHGVLRRCILTTGHKSEHSARGSGSWIRWAEGTPGPSDQEPKDNLPPVKDGWIRTTKEQSKYGPRTILFMDAISEIERLQAERDYFREDRDEHFTALTAASETITKLQAALQYCAEQVWEGYDIDGGSFQDMMVREGLMIEVPADEAFKAEYDSDVMYVMAWSPLATKALKEE